MMTSTLWHLIFFLGTLTQIFATSDPWQEDDDKQFKRSGLDLTSHFPSEDISNKVLTDVKVPAQLISKRSRVRLCGQRLVDAIRMACLMEKSRGKRSLTTEQLLNEVGFPIRFGEEFEYHQQDQAGDSRAFQPRFSAVSFLKGLKKRGAADNCCAMPCTIAHLATYCD